MNLPHELFSGRDSTIGRDGRATVARRCSVERDASLAPRTRPAMRSKAPAADHDSGNLVHAFPTVTIRLPGILFGDREGRFGEWARRTRPFASMI